MADLDFDEDAYLESVRFKHANKPPPAPVAAAIPEGGFKQAFAQSIGHQAAGLGQLASDFVPGVSKDNALKKWGTEYAAAHPTAIRSLEDVAESPWLATKEALGGAAGYMLPLVASVPAGAALGAVRGAGALSSVARGAGTALKSKVGQAATMMPASYGGIREAQGEGAQDLSDKLLALGGAGAVAGIETAFGPQQWALSAMGKEGRAKLAKTFGGGALPSRVGTGVLKGAAIEGTEELVQNPIEQLAAYKSPLTEESLRETAFGGVMGALGGGAMGGMFGVVAGKKDLTKPAAEQPPAQEQPPAPPATPPEQPIGTAVDMFTGQPTEVPLPPEHQAAMEDAVQQAYNPQQRSLLEQPGETLDIFGGRGVTPEATAPEEQEAFNRAQGVLPIQQVDRLKISETGDVVDAEEKPATPSTIPESHPTLVAAKNAFIDAGGTERIWNNTIKKFTTDAGVDDAALHAELSKKVKDPTGARQVQNEAAIAAMEGRAQEETQESAKTQELVQKLVDEFANISKVKRTAAAKEKLVKAHWEKATPVLEAARAAWVKADGQVGEFTTAVNMAKRKGESIDGVARRLLEKTENPKKAKAAKAALKILKKGAPSAVQKPSATKVPVRKEAEVSEGVGRQVRGVKEVAPEVKTEEKVEEKKDGVETPKAEQVKEEKQEAPAAAVKKKKQVAQMSDREANTAFRANYDAAKADWNEQRTDDMPEFSELSDAHQEQWVTEYIDRNAIAGEEVPGRHSIAKKITRVHRANAGITVREARRGVSEEDETQLSEVSKTTKPKNPISVSKLTKTLKGMFRSAPMFDKIVTIYATQAEVVELGLLSSNIKGHVQGFATPDGKIGLIAENIEDGQELGVFLHEVGVHLGMEKLIGKANMKWLDSRILEWAKRKDKSIESEAARAAIARSKASTTDDNTEGRIAYMVEELVSRGVKPKALAGGVEGWLYRMIGAMRIALTKLGLKVFGISGQNMVDLAYGAAGIELGITEKPVELSPQRQSTLFSEARSQAAVDTVVNTHNQILKDIGEIGAMTAGGKLDTALLFVQTLNQIGKTFGHLFPAGTLDRVIKAVNQQAADRIQLIKQGEEIENQYMRVVPMQHRKKLHKIMADSTMRGIYPDKTLEQNKELGTVVTEQDEASWTNMRAEWLAFVSELNKEKAGSGDKTAEIFKAMYKHGDFLFEQKLKEIETIFNRRHAIDVAAATTEHAKNKLAKELRVFEREMGIQRNQVRGPYFPLARFGDHLIIYQSENFKSAKENLETAREALSELENNVTLLDYQELMASRTDARAQWHSLIKKNHIKRAEEQKKRVDEMTAQLKELATDLGPQLGQLKEARVKFRQAESYLNGLKASNADYAVEAFESEFMANKRLKELQTQKGTNNVYKSLAEAHFDSDSRPATRSFMNKVEKSMEGTMTPQQIAKVRSSMKSVLTAMSVNETIRRQRRRQKVAGFEPDMFRGFSSMVRSDAHFLATMKNSELIDQAMTELEQESAESKADMADRKKVVNAVKQHAHSIRDYAGKSLEQKLTRFTSVWMLLTSPAYLTLNMAQQWVIGWPVLAGRFGAKKAADILFKQTALAAKLMQLSSEKGEDATTLSKWINFNLDTGAGTDGKSLLNKSQQKMLDAMMNRQLIDISISSDAGLNSNSGSGQMEKFIKALGAAPHLVEVLNRVGLALAAQELYESSSPKKEGESTEQYQQRVHDYVAEALDNAHLNYSAENEPLFMKRIPFSHVLFQFKKYTEGMLYLIFSNAAKAYWGKKPANVTDEAWAEEKAAARATLKYIAGTHFAVAGVIGLPLSGAAFAVMDAVINSLGDDDDEPWDSETEMRQALAKYLGEDAGLLISKGLPAYAGLDVSTRIGMGNLANPAPFVSKTTQGRDWYNSAIVSTIGGPLLGGLAPKFVEGAAAFRDGDYAKGLEKVSPTLPANAMKAFRMANEGITTKYGNVVVPPEKISGQDAFAKMLGFSPTTESEFYEGQRAVQDVQAHYKDQTAELKKKYIEARRNKDTGAMADLRARLPDINANRRARGMKPITIGELEKSFAASQRYQRELNAKGVRVRPGERGIAEEGSFAAV